jgi:uncharacterized protein with FMN-binding domain
MILLINVVLAWISVGLIGVLSIIWLMRLYIKKHRIKKERDVYRLNRMLRKYHKWTGISFVVIASVHGILSSYKLLSLNFGTLIVVFSILMGITYYLRKKFNKGSSWLSIHRALTLMILILIPVHIIEVGGLVGMDALVIELNGDHEIVYQEMIEDITSNVYNDGVYIGEATGYCPGLTVSVVIHDNSIDSIEIIEHNEQRESYFLPAFESIPSQIVDGQSLEVDTVSGSTYSSIGIVNAVADALSDALVSGEIIPIETELNVNQGKGRNRH